MKPLLLLLWLLAASAGAEPARFGAYCLEVLPGGRQEWEDRKLCEERFSPCSTFKIPNALIALQERKLKDEHEVLRWDGQKREIESWNRDHDLTTAIPESVVWFFQELARRLGKEPYRRHLQEFHYGNQDLSAAVDQFWLSSSLRISVREQVAFLTRLDMGTLKIQRHWQDVVKRILQAKQGGGYALLGKTGSGTTPDGRPLGWYVGMVHHGQQHFVFATVLIGKDAGDEGGYPGLRTRRRAVAWLTEKGFLKGIQPW